MASERCRGCLNLAREMCRASRVPNLPCVAVTRRTGPTGRLARPVVLLLAAVTLAACIEPGAVAPDQNCRNEAGIQVCLERLLFAPGDPLPVEIANGTQRTVHACAGAVVGRRSPAEEWDADFGVVVHGCPPNGTAEDPLAAIRVIPPGGRIEDQLHVNNCAYEGQWKVVVYLIDDAGAVVEELSSPIFDVRGPNAFYCRS